MSGRRGGELLYKVNTIIQLGNNLRFQAKLYPHLAPMQEIMRSDPSITYHLTSHQLMLQLEGRVKVVEKVKKMDEKKLGEV